MITDIEKLIDDIIERIMNTDGAYDAFQVDGDMHVIGMVNVKQAEDEEFIGSVDIRQSDRKQLYEDLLELENDLIDYRIRNGVAFIKR